VTEPSTHGVFLADAAGVVVECDANCAALLSRDDAVGVNLLTAAFGDADDAARWWRGLGPDATAHQGQLGDGSSRRLKLVAHRTEAGVRGFIVDVTAQVETLDRYRLLTDQSPYGVVIIQDDVIVYSNEAQEARSPSLGRSASAVLRESMHPEDLELVRKRIAAREAGESVPSNYRYRWLLDGKVLWQEVWSSRVEYRGRPAVQAMSLDVTESVRMQEQLNHAQKMEVIGQLAGGVAHDFNNLLTIILGSVELAALSTDPDERSDFLDEIRHASTRASQLTRQLLTFSRREPVKPVRIDLNDVVDQVQRMLRRLVGEHIILQVALSGTSLPVLIDPGQLEQIITNLVVNARDSMPQGGRIDVTTSLTHIEPGPGEPPHVRSSLQVRDTGEGIPPEIQERVFEPFFTTKDAGHGTGLGLATVLSIVQQHGGHIDLDSTPGVGTAMTIHLPLDAGETSKEERASNEGPLETSGRVLVVEDDAGIRKITAKLLRQAGFETLVASDGQAAFEQLDAGAGVDLVLSDVVMPRMSGVELRDVVGTRWPALPVLLMTGYADVEVLPVDQRDGVLSKPFQPGDLVRAVLRVLDRTRTVVNGP